MRPGRAALPPALITRNPHLHFVHFREDIKTAGRTCPFSSRLKAAAHINAGTSAGRNASRWPLTSSLRAARLKSLRQNVPGRIQGKEPGRFSWKQSGSVRGCEGQVRPERSPLLGAEGCRLPRDGDGGWGDGGRGWRGEGAGIASQAWILCRVSEPTCED